MNPEVFQEKIRRDMQLFQNQYIETAWFLKRPQKWIVKLLRPALEYHRLTLCTEHSRLGIAFSLLPQPLPKLEESHKPWLQLEVGVHCYVERIEDRLMRTYHKVENSKLLLRDRIVSTLREFYGFRDHFYGTQHP